MNREEEAGKKLLKKRIIAAIAGNCIMSVCVVLLRLAGFGTDPFSAMNLGVSGHLPISYGTYQLLFNLVLFVPIFYFDRKSFGLGAFVNMFILGYLVMGVQYAFTCCGITISSMEPHRILRILLMIFAVVVVSFSCALYMEADMGAAPWDRLGMVIETQSGGRLKYRYVRIVYDTTAVVIAYFTGAAVGLATVIVGFCLGPLISFFRAQIRERWLKLKADEQKR